MSWDFSGLLRISLLLACALCHSAPATARGPDEGADAEQRERARALAQQGIALLEQQRWQEAHQRLSEAFALYQAPTLAVLDASALEKLGRLVEAQERYQDALRLPLDQDAPDPFKTAVREAKRADARLQSVIPRLTIDLRHAEPPHVLLLNAEPVPRSEWARPRKLDPGTHTVIVKRGSVVELSERIAIESGAALNVVLSLARRVPDAAEPRPEPVATPRSPVFAWTSLGIGAAGLTTGVIAGAVMLNAKSDLDSRCQDACPPESEDTLDRYRTARLWSAVGYSAAAVGLGLGFWLLLDDEEPSTPTTGSLVLHDGGGQLRVQGAF